MFAKLLIALFAAQTSPFAEPARSAAPSAELTRASAAGMSTAELAERLLGPGAAAEVTHHELTDPVFADGPLPGLRFLSHLRPFGGDLCRRDSVYVSFEPVEAPSAESTLRDVPVAKRTVSEGEQIVLAPGCRLPAGASFASVRSGSVYESAHALRRLASLQASARSAAPLPATLRCTSELPENPCGKDFRAVLAGLPLHQIYIVQPPSKIDGNTGWEFSVMPKGPGHEPFWEVLLEEMPGQRPELRLNWRIPPPF